MGLKYWYIVFAVHTLITSSTFAVVYSLSAWGIDMVSVLSKFPLSGEYVKTMNSAQAGHIALALLFIKLLTPVRFALTLTSSSFLVKYLENCGIIS